MLLVAESTSRGEGCRRPIGTAAANLAQAGGTLRMLAGKIEVTSLNPGRVQSLSVPVHRSIVPSRAMPGLFLM